MIPPDIDLLPDIDPFLNARRCPDLSSDSGIQTQGHPDKYHPATPYWVY